MLRSDIEHFLKYWYNEDVKVFKYVRPLVPVEYIVIHKKDENTFQIDTKESTYIINDMDLETITSLLIQEELIFYMSHSSTFDGHKIKTNSCDKGCWILNNGLHDLDCSYHKSWNYRND